MPIILGEARLGYEIFGTESKTVTLTLYQPDGVLWSPSYYGEFEFGSTAFSDYHIEAEIETVIE